MFIKILKSKIFDRLKKYQIDKGYNWASVILRAEDGCQTATRRRNAFQKECKGRRRKAFQGRASGRCSQRWKICWYRILKIK